jgi:hypothetical protein
MNALAVQDQLLTVLVERTMKSIDLLPLVMYLVLAPPTAARAQGTTKEKTSPSQGIQIM